MTTSLISWTTWRTFFEALRREQAPYAHQWLRHWAFADGGAALMDKREDAKSSRLSLEEKQKQAALYLMTHGIWPKTRR